jgi:cytoskeleton protein RodZ
MSAQDSHYAQMIEPDRDPTGTARIGAELRQVRDRLGWKLADVAAELRIREPYLDAIEHGDLDALPGPAYQIGFVRAYARILGLDGEEILRRFRAEGAGAVKTPELSFLAPVPDRAVPSGAIVLLGVVVLLAGYGLWYLHTESDRTLAASIPAQLAPLAVPPAPPAPKPAPAVAQAVQAVKPAVPAVVSAPGVATPGVATPGVATPGASTPGAAPAAPATVAAAVPGTAPAAATAAPPAAAPANGKTIQATADSWVEVKDASGNILFSRVMHSGDSWPVPDMPGLTMTAGNAGGTEISDNGTAGAPLGSTGTVLRNYALTPASATVPPAPGAAAPAVMAPGTPAPASTAPAGTTAPVTPPSPSTASH